MRVHPCCALILPVLAVLACGDDGPADDDPTVPERCLAHLDPEAIPEGRWVKYRWCRGDEEPTYTKVSVVKKTADEFWVESDMYTSVRDPGSVIQFRVDRKSGNVRQAYWKKANGSVILLAVDRRDPAERAEYEISGSNVEGTVTLADKSTKCRILTAKIVTKGGGSQEVRRWVVEQGPLPVRITTLEKPFGGRANVTWEERISEAGTIVRQEDTPEYLGRKETTSREIVEWGDDAKVTVQPKEK